MITKKSTKLPNLIFDLDNIMTKRNITDEKLAKDTNLSIGVIKKLRENKLHKIDIKSLAKLCYVLNCQPNDIIKFNEKN